MGATYGMGHKLGTDPQCQVISTEPQTSVSDTTTYKVNNGLEIPDTYSAGFTLEPKNVFKFGFDYNFQKWSSIDYPQYKVVNNKPGILLQVVYLRIAISSHWS